MKFLALVLSAFLALWPFPATRPANAVTEKNAVYLTFDDGPTDSTTPHVLDILQKYHVRATFFVIGRQIKGREAILRRMDREGHAIGVHSYTHRYQEIYRSADTLLQDIERCRQSITAVLPRYNRRIYRFPGGSFLCPHLRSAVTEAGYRYYDWNAAARDAEGNFTAEELFQNVVSSAQNKDPVLLLLHDGVGYRQTLLALPKIIEYFQQNGYRFQTL